MLKEINKFIVRRVFSPQPGQPLADLAQNFAAGEAGFRRKRLRSGAWTFTQGMHCAEKFDGGIDLVVAEIDNVVTIDPAQQCITALIVYRDDPRHHADMMMFQKAESPHFCRKSVARIVVARWILLQCENAGAALHSPDAAVTPPADDRAKLDGAADKGPRDFGRLCQAFIKGAQKSGPRCLATSR